MVMVLLWQFDGSRIASFAVIYLKITKYGVEEKMTIKMKKKLKKALGIYLPLIIIAFITAAPVIWSIITSFKMPEDVFKLPVRYIPAPATFSNYIISWTRNKFSMYFFNSLAIGLGSSYIYCCVFHVEWVCIVQI